TSRGAACATRSLGSARCCCSPRWSSSRSCRGLLPEPMTLVWASLIVVTSAVAGIAAILLVRRRAPEGSYFADGDRAAGVFGVLATGFAILAGFVVVLAFQSYDTAR